MGLDNYASRSPGLDLTEEDRKAFEEADIHLGQGDGGFRGKLYQELILNVTGVSLYQDWIPPEVVRGMCEALERCDPEEATKRTSFYEAGRMPSSVSELRKFFRVCVERNLGLVSSW